MQSNEDVLDRALAITFACFTQRLDVPQEEIALDSDVKELTKGNIYLFGHALLDVHEILGLHIQYEPLTEYETFSTVEDVVNYFYAFLAEKEAE